MNFAGPVSDASPDCERILRTLPLWFGIEESLLEYVADSAHFPTFLAILECRPVAFVTVRQHFHESWEVHCIAVEAAFRGSGVGQRLHEHVENWLRGQGAKVLQVKTLAPSHPSPEYAETRGFYARVGYAPLEVFPALWGSGLPVLQLVKSLASMKNAV